MQVARRVLGRSVKSQKQFRAQVDGKSGLEVGGPSAVFQDDGVLPLYRHLQGLDNCVYSLETIWEGRRTEGPTFSYHPHKRNGFNFVREATDLHGIADYQYDFVLSSHSLEHTANPVKALKEWVRVAKPGGAIIILLPDYRQTFDHRRTPTPIAHMLDDYGLGTDETDTTHLQEIIALHDNSRQLLEAAGLTVEILELAKPFHIVILARCPLVSRIADRENGHLLSCRPRAEHYTSDIS